MPFYRLKQEAGAFQKGRAYKKLNVAPDGACEVILVFHLPKCHPDGVLKFRRNDILVVFYGDDLIAHRGGIFFVDGLGRQFEMHPARSYVP